MKTVTMPKSKEYLSSDSSDNDSETEVQDKKRKKETKEKPAPKKSKKEEVPKEDEKSWHIGQQRYVEVKDFRGKLYVDVREKYVDSKTADMKPGKKGIFLTVQQWRKMLEVADDVNSALSRM